MRKKKNNIRRNLFSPAIFLFFIIVAVCLIILLEYIEFNRGKNSFIFTRIFSQKKPADNASDLNRNLLDILRRNDINFDYFMDISGKYHFKIEPEKKKFDKISESIVKLSRESGFRLVTIEVKRVKNKTIFLYHTLMKKVIYHYILISKNEFTEKKKDKKILSGRTIPRLAFIIDDIGAHSLGALALKKLGIPITASVLPFSQRGYEEAGWIHEYGLEEMIHLPMQPKKNVNNGYSLENTIKVDSSEEYIRSLLKRAQKLVPYAKGINNHQGSLVTSKKKIMKKILRIIKDTGLFFIDSKTDFDSVAYKTAEEMNIKTAERDVFIDHIQSYDHSMFQIRRLINIAKRKGNAIAIGHPFKTTFKAIADSIKLIRSEGVEIVFVKDLVK